MCIQIAEINHLELENVDIVVYMNMNVVNWLTSFYKFLPAAILIYKFKNN